MPKTFARLLLVLMTVGGGFAGVLAAAGGLITTKQADLRVLFLMWIALALYSLITAAGLMFVQSARLTRIMLVAIAIQIPWFDLSGIKYRLSSAMYLAMTFGPPKGAGRIGTYIGWSAQIGSQFQFRVGGGPDGDWNFGINLFAVFLFIVWLLYTKTGRSSEL